MSLSVATLRTTCTHSLLYSSYDPADPALPHPLIYRSPPSPNSLPQMVPEISSISVPRAFYPWSPHRIRGHSQTTSPPSNPHRVLPQRPNPSSFRDRDATLREKREMQTLDHVGGTHVCNAIFHSSGLENPTPFRTKHPTCNRPTPVCRPAPAAANVCLALTSCTTS